MKSLWQIMVPTQRNKPIGKNPGYSTRYHRIWDSKVRKITNGLTIQKPVRGQWFAPDGELFVERMIPVLIYCTEEQIDAIADMSAAYYDQKAIMYYKITDTVVIKHYPTELEKKLDAEQMKLFPEVK
jgi:hypothetical protein